MFAASKSASIPSHTGPLGWSSETNIISAYRTGTPGNALSISGVNLPVSAKVNAADCNGNPPILIWPALTENMDGTRLTTLSGYTLRLGMMDGQYTKETRIDKQGGITYVCITYRPTHNTSLKLLLNR